MDPSDPSLTAPAEQLAALRLLSERELAELDALSVSLEAERSRHEMRRAELTERWARLKAEPAPAAAELLEIGNALLGATGRANMVAGSADVVAKKREGLTAVLHACDLAGALAVSAPTSAELAIGTDAVAAEALRRELVRRVHDGPAQALTNIILQAQIVSLLVGRDPERVRVEVDNLVAMAEGTLAVTKTLIGDIRPMILDDLGLLATLRHIERDRSARARVPIEIVNEGREARLPSQVESILFRLLDEAVCTILAGEPAGLRIHLEWTAGLVRITVGARDAEAGNEAAEAPSLDHLPPALRKMIIEDRARETVRLPVGGLASSAPRLSSLAAVIGARLTVDPTVRPNLTVECPI